MKRQANSDSTVTKAINLSDWDGAYAELKNKSTTPRPEGYETAKEISERLDKSRSWVNLMIRRMKKVGGLSTFRWSYADANGRIFRVTVYKLK